VEIRSPVADEERLELYLAWHRMREATRGWETVCESMESYAQTFCLPHPCARELDYYEGDRLVGVGLVDETPAALSSVYFYYHPDWRDRSLGTASVLFELAHAADRGRSHLYLGYRVQACISTAYKAAFRPHELLEGRPVAEDMPRWSVP
jgi:arginine-tRNA-protein transferase